MQTMQYASWTGFEFGKEGKIYKTKDARESFLFIHRNFALFLLWRFENIRHEKKMISREIRLNCRNNCVSIECNLMQSNESHGHFSYVGRIKKKKDESNNIINNNNKNQNCSECNIIQKSPLGVK